MQQIKLFLCFFFTLSFRHLKVRQQKCRFQSITRLLYWSSAIVHLAQFKHNSIYTQILSLFISVMSSKGLHHMRQQNLSQHNPRTLSEDKKNINCQAMNTSQLSIHITETVTIAEHIEITAMLRNWPLFNIFSSCIMLLNTLCTFRWRFT